MWSWLEPAAGVLLIAIVVHFALTVMRRPLIHRKTGPPVAARHERAASAHPHRTR